MTASGSSDPSPAGDTVSIEKIVSLCKQRGFIFPSLEIYGGVGLDVRLRPLRRAAWEVRLALVRNP
jgi:hypothetical protein